MYVSLLLGMETLSTDFYIFLDVQHIKLASNIFSLN